MWHYVALCGAVWLFVAVWGESMCLCCGKALTLTLTLTLTRQ